MPESWRHLSFPCGSWRLASWIDALTRRVRLFQEPGEAVDLRGLYVPGNVLSTWSHADDVLRLAQSPAYQPQDAPGWQPTRTRMQELGLSRSNTSSSAARAKLERQLQREKARRLEAMPALTGACFEGVWVVGVSLDTAKLEEDDAAPLGVNWLQMLESKYFNFQFDFAEPSSPETSTTVEVRKARIDRSNQGVEVNFSVLVTFFPEISRSVVVSVRNNCCQLLQENFVSILFFKWE